MQQTKQDRPARATRQQDVLAILSPGTCQEGIMTGTAAATRKTTRLNLLAMFAGPLERDSLASLEEAGRILGKFGFEIDCFPHPNRAVTTGYKALHDMTGSLEWWKEPVIEIIRKWTLHCFRDQLAWRVPVVFCRLAKLTRDDSNPGITKHVGTPQSLILLDPIKAGDLPQSLAHEIGHAAGLCPADPKDPDKGHDRRPYSLMYNGNQGLAGTNTNDNWLDASQVAAIRAAYFARPI